MHAYARLAVLKWWLDAEPDDGLYWHGQGIHKASAECSCGRQHDKGTPWYVFGFGTRPTDASHFPTTGAWQRYVCDDTKKLLIEQFASGHDNVPVFDTPHIGGAKIIKNDTLICRPGCPLCGNGESSVHHWLIFCPVLNSVLAILLSKPNITLADWFPSSHKQFSIVGYTIFHARRELIALNAFGHGKYAPPNHVAHQRQAATIRQLVQAILSSTPYVIQQCIQVRGINTAAIITCEHEHCLYSSVVVPQLLCDRKPRKEARQQKATADFDFTAGTTICATHCQSYLQVGLQCEGVWVPPPRRVPAQDANAIVDLTRCKCGRESLTQIRTTAGITKGQEITIPFSELRATNNCIIIAFDGSTRDPSGDSPSSGGGIYGWQIADDCINTVWQEAAPFPDAANSFEAEALAAVQAIKATVILARKYPGHKIEIQGDNSAVVQFWRGEARMASTKIHQLCKKALHILPY